MAEGQIYAPDVNIFMLVAAIALTLYFRASENLADAYGIAVTGTMFITSVLFFFVTRKVWHWSLMKALPLCLLFWALDLTYFGACLGKITTGGWFPLGMAMIIVVIMVTWWDGWKALAIKVMTKTISKEQFVERSLWKNPCGSPAPGFFCPPSTRRSPPCCSTM